MGNRIIEIVELGKPQSIIQREGNPITELIHTHILIEELNEQLNIHSVSGSLQLHSNKIELLDRYTKFLQKNGYIDTDATCEEPFAIDEFLRNDR